MQHPFNKKILIVLGLFVLGGAAWYTGLIPNTRAVENHVGAPLDISTWQTARDDGAHVSFRFPAELPTQYIYGEAWPPMVTIEPGSYDCPQSAAATPAEPAQRERRINKHTYCVRTTTEGAAGSTYTTHIYTTERNEKIVSFRFVLRTPQCANYDEPQKSACETEQETFDVDNLVDHIIQSMVFDR